MRKENDNVSFRVVSIERLSKTRGKVIYGTERSNLGCVDFAEKTSIKFPIASWLREVAPLFDSLDIPENSCDQVPVVTNQRKIGKMISDEYLAHILLLGWQHVNLLARYEVDLDQAFPLESLRPLRKSMD